MPHAPSDATEFERRNGAFTLTIVRPARRRAPLWLGTAAFDAWLTTEAVRTQETTVSLDRPVELHGGA